ncbi:MAG: bifunctional diaminohydroxyphosphoribosylaminopyrimidine deaminase/5-amino-6-(5-phosphoribosylamino)uracil reductase RibD [Bacteroidota bacterium]|nr:bifunctional diaminohydroxyphosphoribosylaminopyrimidine deaminase/5-amino-6-(5-phosphoribosylamino)uracil reductase RibD [Bacteroidota bacterium]
MQRCIELARLGLGNTAPNPMVGSVVVYDNKIIGEGYHRKCGEAHAEVNAINSVKNKELLQKSTLYVNLEPCSHFGKTPPCANLIAQLKIPEVVIGTIDTASHVSGKGIEILKQAGCKVTVGMLEKESREINKRFFTFHEKKRPYIILKWAETLDGFIDVLRSRDHPIKPTWITNEFSKMLVHKWRAEEQAILIGTNTASTDNPTLTTRNWPGTNPLRIVFDRDLKLSSNLNIFNKDAETVIVADNLMRNKLNKKFHSNIGTLFVDDNHGFDKQLFSFFINHHIQSVIIEGGAKVLNYFIANGLWDEARIFIGNKKFMKGVKAPQITGKVVQKENLDNSKLHLIKNKTIFNQN